MAYLYWDASALVKRYFSEDGTDTVRALFAMLPSLLMAATYMGYAETLAILLRKHNQKRLDANDLNLARNALFRDVLNNSAFDLLTITDSDVLAGTVLTEQHNINSTDAAILATFLRHQQDQVTGNAPCVLVTSDLRLIRAASVEGLPALNPETVAAADVPSFLAALCFPIAKGESRCRVFAFVFHVCS